MQERRDRTKQPDLACAAPAEGGPESAVQGVAEGQEQCHCKQGKDEEQGRPSVTREPLRDRSIARGDRAPTRVEPRREQHASHGDPETDGDRDHDDRDASHAHTMRPTRARHGPRTGVSSGRAGIGRRRLYDAAR